jgi:transcriptional regulator with XRE-family HTH domain
VVGTRLLWHCWHFVPTMPYPLHAVNGGAMQRRRRTVDPKRSPEAVEFGRLLQLARVRSRRTQRDLAHALGVNLTTLAKYEIGLHLAPPKRVRMLAKLLSAPELLEAGRGTSAEEGLDPTPADRGAGNRADLMVRREALFDWWSERVIEIRKAEKLDVARIDEIRIQLCDRVTDLLRGEGVPLNNTDDKALIRYAERELQTILQFRREHNRPKSSAA